MHRGNIETGAAADRMTRMLGTTAFGSVRQSIAMLAVVSAALASGCRPGRVEATEFEQIVGVLDLKAGMSVADVGAGEGRWSLLLARYVGENGHVWATEVDARELEEIQEQVSEMGLENVTVVLGGQLETGLPEACCDAILLRLVYHHFKHPSEMRASLRRALRPDGRIAIVDIEPQSTWRDLPEVPDRGGHGIPLEDLVAEMIGDGFTVVSRHERWNDDAERYCVVFKP